MRFNNRRSATPQDVQRWLSVDETSHALGVEPGTIDKMIAARVITAYRLGDRQPVFDATAVYKLRRIAAWARGRWAQ